MYSRHAFSSSQKYPERQNSGKTPTLTPRSLKILATRRTLSLLASTSGTWALMLASPMERREESSEYVLSTTVNPSAVSTPIGCFRRPAGDVGSSRVHVTSVRRPTQGCGRDRASVHPCRPERGGPTLLPATEWEDAEAHRERSSVVAAGPPPPEASR